SSAQLSEYIISRLEAAVVNGGKLVVVDRANLDKIREEQGFQLSGDVDDNSAKDIGKMVGAGAIVTGSFINLGDAYGLSLKAINMETAAVAASYPADIARSTRIETLLASGGGAAGTQTAQKVTTGGNTAVPATQAPVTSAAQTPTASAVQAPAASAVQSPTVPTASVQTPAQPAPIQSKPNEPLYKIGDKGPAGGLVFYGTDINRADTTPSPVNREYQAGETGPANGLVFYGTDMSRANTTPPPVNREYQAGETGPAGGVVFYPTALVKAAPPPVTREYQVGDTGPAGGVIFYVNPQAGDWKYLEAAPASTEENRNWSQNNQTVGGTKTDIGTGKANTDRLVNHSLNGGAINSAALYCDNLSTGGFDDWFLPSKAELNLMFINLKLRGLGGFKEKWYWSSSEVNQNAVWIQHFSNGVQRSDYSPSEYIAGKHQAYLVRAIRQF
ncbi:MAG: DUF1566 domain-containing protein, partial [Treponema sp.]|nr:DUF1566 domain-containing protein [Treponema sp.]